MKRLELQTAARCATATEEGAKGRGLTQPPKALDEVLEMAAGPGYRPVAEASSS